MNIGLELQSNIALKATPSEPEHLINKEWAEINFAPLNSYNAVKATVTVNKNAISTINVGISTIKHEISIIKNSISVIKFNVKNVNNQIIGDGSLVDFEVFHNYDKKNVSVTVMDADTDSMVLVAWTATSNDSVTIHFTNPPEDGKTYNVVIIG